MNVDDAVGVTLNHVRRDQAEIAGEHHQVDCVLVECRKEGVREGGSTGCGSILHNDGDRCPRGALGGADSSTARHHQLNARRRLTDAVKTIDQRL